MVVFHVSHKICGRGHNNWYASTRISTKILQTTTSDFGANSEYGIGDAADLLNLRIRFYYYIHLLYLGERMEPPPSFLSLCAKASASF